MELNRFIKKPLIITLGLFITINSFAQTYWREVIDTVSVSGYYNIELSQEIAGLGLNSLLILDANDHEIPYLVRSSVPVKEMRQIELYNLVSDVQHDSVNTIIVHNAEAEVSRFYIQMKEAEVTKHISIRGSYDRKQWFSVKQNSLLYSEHNPSLGEIAIVDFPKGDYTYYELTIINNSRSALNNITGVGKIEKSSIYGQFVELSLGNFVLEEDKDNTNTIITFPSIPSPYFLSRIDFQITGKAHYSRNIRLEKNGYNLEIFQISSRNEPVYYVNSLLIDRDTRIVIENESNPPLAITNVKLFGLSRYLCAYLEAGATYHIETSRKNNHRYDIQDFANEISLNLPIVKTGDLQKEMITEEPERELRFFERPFFLWGVIALTELILLFICFRMLKELKKKN